MTDVIVPGLRCVDKRGKRVCSGGGSGFLRAAVMWGQRDGEEIPDKMHPDFPNDGLFSVTMKLQVPPSPAVPVALPGAGGRGCWHAERYLASAAELSSPERELCAVLSTSRLNKVSSGHIPRPLGHHMGFPGLEIPAASSLPASKHG